jgi:hypothetical protein
MMFSWLKAFMPCPLRQAQANPPQAAMKAPSRIATAGDGGQFVIGEFFRSSLGCQILKLHLLEQHSRNDF